MKNRAYVLHRGWTRERMDDESAKIEQTTGISNLTSSDTNHTLSIRGGTSTCESWDKDHSFTFIRQWGMYVWKAMWEKCRETPGLIG